MPRPKPEPSPAEWAPLSSLLRYPGNPRHNEVAVPVVADSIRRFGFGAPMIARRANRMILAGHARRGAALLLAERWAKATSRERATWHADAVRVAERGEVVVRFVDLDGHDAALYLVADNHIGETLSTTDDEQLAALLVGERAAGVDVLEGTGLDAAALARILGEPAGAGVTGGDPGDGRYREQYGVIVVCPDEAAQQRIYEQLKHEGFDCRVVVT